MSEIRRLKIRDKDGDVLQFRGDREDDTFYFDIQGRLNRDARTTGAFTKDEVQKFLYAILDELDDADSRPEFVVDKLAPQ